ncbi:MAG: protein translocase subunit SecD [Rhodospirillales bacterium]|nr:protein translocase subunit SecD [Rhodospirillales bacterium]
MVYFSKTKTIMVLLVCLFGLAFSLPNFFKESTLASLPDWLPHKHVNLGLDLQGGSHLLLEVEINAVIREQLETLVDDVRIELRKAKINYTGLGVSGTSAVKVTIRKADETDQARTLVRAIAAQSDVSVDNNTILVEMTDREIADRRNAAMQQSVEIVRRRIDETGTREPTIQRQGDDRILVQLPGVKDPERIKALLGKTAKMSFHLTDDRLDDAIRGRVPPGASLLPRVDPTQGFGQVLIKKRVMVSGEDLVDSQPSTDSQSGQPVVTFRFNSRGSKKFGAATAANVNRPFAIVLDGKVISDPVIREPILGGSGQISGNFTFQEATDLALLLRAGALPAPLAILEERSVGPGLGADSISAGKIASILGMILVVVFMAIAYGRFGLMADAALIINMILILGGLSALQATLTLPGIAGIVLTIGMAVDANVLIFERIREEVRLGRGPVSAIDAGYSRALTTIIDANVTTLIAAALLFVFGSGPIKGFAVTLGIGIVTSMFTAIMLTRLFVIIWLRRTNPKELPI